MNIKTKLKKALEEAMTDVQVYEFQLTNNRFLRPDEAEWRVRALFRAQGKVELIAQLLGIPNRLKEEASAVPSQPLPRLDAIADDIPF